MHVGSIIWLLFSLQRPGWWVCW